MTIAGQASPYSSGGETVTGGGITTGAATAALATGVRLIGTVLTVVVLVAAGRSSSRLAGSVGAAATPGKFTDGTLVDEPDGAGNESAAASMRARSQSLARTA